MHSCGLLSLYTSCYFFSSIEHLSISPRAMRAAGWPGAEERLKLDAPTPEYEQIQQRAGTKGGRSNQPTRIPTIARIITTFNTRSEVYSVTFMAALQRNAVSLVMRTLNL